jgi:hypothetical protein
VGQTPLFYPGIQATRWTSETGLVPLGDLATDEPPPGTIARGISADGKTIVGLSSANGAFSWTQEGGFILLGKPDGTGEALAEA